MSKKTISQALKDLFLGLGGDPSALADNTTASDYIQDLESAIKAGAGAQIDDSTASETTTYSGAKIESLIPENELPAPAVGDIGKVVSVVSDGESGAEYDLTTPSAPSPTIRDITLTLGAYDVSEDYGEVTCDKTLSEIKGYFDAGDVLHIKDTDGYYYSICELLPLSGGSYRISFLGARFESGTMVMYLVGLADGEYTKRVLNA